MSSTSDTAEIGVSRDLLSALAVDIWKIKRRASKAEVESVVLACDRAFEHLEEIGIECKEMVGDQYDQHLRANVIHHDGGTVNLRIVECFSPAVYFTNRMGGDTELIRRAEIAVQGDQG